MTEFLAIITALFVAYLLYEIVKTFSEAGRQSGAPAPAQAAPASPAPPPAAAPAEPPKAEAAAEAEHSKVVHLRDPKTGEVSPVPGNYRFAKKWIKEAMVAEGLLNKVYKNSELTDAVNATAKAALEQFKSLEKYQA